MTSDMVALSRPDPPWKNQQRLNDIVHRHPSIFNIVAQSALNPAAVQSYHQPITTRWQPRSRTGHSAWRSDLDDQISTSGLYDFTTRPKPTLEDVRITFPDVTGYELFDLYTITEDAWRQANTKLYHLVKGTIDLTGAWADKDNNFITMKFHDGPNRDGLGFLEWCDSFVDVSDVASQDEVQLKVSTMKLENGMCSINKLEAHCTTLLSHWLQIKGNSIESSGTFNYRLLNSLPQTPGTHVGMLRSWLAEKITDGAAFLADPYALIDKMLKHARTLGINDVPGCTEPEDFKKFNMVHATFNKNDCKFCDCFTCISNKQNGITDCVCMNAEKDISKFTGGVQNYIKMARQWISEHPGTQSVKGQRFNSISFVGQQTSSPGQQTKSIDQVTHVGKLTTSAATDKAPSIESIEEFKAYIEKRATGHRVNVIADGDMIAGGNTQAPPPKISQSNKQLLAQLDAHLGSLGANRFCAPMIAPSTPAAPNQSDLSPDDLLRAVQSLPSPPVPSVRSRIQAIESPNGGENTSRPPGPPTIETPHDETTALTVATAVKHQLVRVLDLVTRKISSLTVSQMGCTFFAILQLVRISRNSSVRRSLRTNLRNAVAALRYFILAKLVTVPLGVPLLNP